MKPKRVSRNFVQKRLPIRTKHSNKTNGGKLLAIAGSKGMYGAGILVALAATRSGSGYTYLMMDWNNQQLLSHPDFLFSAPKTSLLKKISPSAIVFGPGIGKNYKSKRWLKFLRKNYVGPVLIDADGLNILASERQMKLPHNWILTPHEGELSRLLKCSSNEIKKNPIQSILKAQKLFGSHVILKGANTYIANGTSLFHVQSGTPALAKAGTGDVLAGIIGALLSQGLSSLESAIVGTYVHGYASQVWIQKNDMISLRPLDLIELLPKTLRSIRYAKSE
jgi:hydroxyethylthiazole kinase-like uncharacterized protein yjeF